MSIDVAIDVEIALSEWRLQQEQALVRFLSPGAVGIERARAGDPAGVADEICILEHPAAQRVDERVEVHGHAVEIPVDRSVAEKRAGTVVVSSVADGDAGIVDV